MSDKTPEQFVMEWLEWAKNRTTVGIVWPGSHIHDAALMIEDWAADGERILVDTQEQLKRTVTDYKNLQETYRYETKQLKDAACMNIEILTHLIDFIREVESAINKVADIGPAADLSVLSNSRERLSRVLHAELAKEAQRLPGARP